MFETQNVQQVQLRNCAHTKSYVLLRHMSIYTPTKVGIILNRNYWYQIQVLEGIYRFSRPGNRWWTRVIPHLNEKVLLENLRDFAPDGILVAFGHGAATQRLSSAIPTVTVGGNLSDGTSGRVGYDDRAIGALAGEHLASHGIRSALIVGNSQRDIVVERAEGFRTSLQSHGVLTEEMDEEDFRAVNPLPGVEWIATYPPLIESIKRLPKPLGIFAWNDELGTYVSDIVRLEGFHVPRDVLILGANNNALNCGLSSPPLSSVEIPFVDAGLTAAVMLDKMMNLGQAFAEHLVLPPARVVERESTMRERHDDELVHSFVSLLQSAKGIRMSTNDLCKKLGCSRRTLERRTEKALSQSLLELRQTARLQHAEELLKQDIYTISAIAAECGFSSTKSLGNLFQSKHGMSPGAFRDGLRRQNRTMP